MSVCAGSRGTAGAPRAKPGPARSGGGGGVAFLAGITFLSLGYTECEHNMPTHTVRLSDVQANCQHNLYSYSGKTGSVRDWH